MANSYFSFKKFTVHQEKCAMKVTTDACMFGAWCASEIEDEKIAKDNLLDIGTGTGLLSLMIAQKNKLKIDAVEIDNTAAEQAIENISNASFTNIKVHHSDIISFQKTGYHYIISNPPFYEDELSSPSPARSAAHHGTALLWNELFNIISNKLLPNGKFFLLLPYKRNSTIDTLLQAHDLYLEKRITVGHSADHPPSRILIKGSKQKAPLIEEAWQIKDGEGYSKTFISLLKDYYLYL
jgi:tRNA1Val (adenine37-N6)-methyltransferase